MIEMVLVYCLTADPAPGMACLMGAQLAAQRYVAEHPEWQLAGWRCEIDVAKKERI